MTKLAQFYESVLAKPALVVAPMVDQSELAWRILSRRYGATLCYTPMFNAGVFLRSALYRKENFTTNKQDRPLIVQFCANDAETLVQAAKLVEKDCDAVDLNLGCPQHIAKRGKYGAFLMEDWDLIREMVSSLSKELSIPVTCKIRVFPQVEKTIAYAKMLQDAGCKLLTVHGRTREQKGHNTGLADWEQIKKVKESLSIPVFANGNLLYYSDIQDCLDKTNADGVMSAEGNLYNPLLFINEYKPHWEVAQEYLDIVKIHGAPLSAVKGHLYKLFNPCLSTNTDVRSRISECKSLDQIQEQVDLIRERMSHKVTPLNNLVKNADGFIELPDWVCQPYVRPPKPDNALTEISEIELETRKRKQTEYLEYKKKRQESIKCKGESCEAVRSPKCDHYFCKSCCFDHQISSSITCSQHKRKVKATAALVAQ